MPDPPSDPIAWLKGLAESATRVRLPPGVLGKTHTVMVGIMVIWTVVIFRLSGTELYLDAGLIGCGAAATWVGLRWCRESRDFAVKNPALALMEGADITDYQRFQAEAKVVSIAADLPSVPSPSLNGQMPVMPIGVDRDGSAGGILRDQQTEAPPRWPLFIRRPG